MKFLNDRKTAKSKLPCALHMNETRTLQESVLLDFHQIWMFLNYSPIRGFF